MAEQTRPSEAGGQEGDAALQISLHPLVVINMSDHFTRFRAQSQSGEAHVPRVFGAVLGEQSGRKVELGNSFEMKVTGGGTTALAIAIDYLKQRLEQYKKTFPKYEMLGWYSTASALEPSDLMLHTTLTEAISESLLYCTLDPQGLLTAGKELPITIYESEVAIINEKPTPRFVKAAYKVDSIESERIAVDHVAHILPSGSSNLSSALAQHIGSQYTAISMLAEQIDVIRSYLGAVAQGKVPRDHAVLRLIKSIIGMLPALETPRFRQEMLRDHNNTMLISYISAITKGTAILNEVVDKFGIAFDKHSRRRGIF